MVVLDSAVAMTLPLRRRVARVAPWFGPAFVAAIAYTDPGNFATNFTGGARLGYQLIWVIVVAAFTPDSALLWTDTPRWRSRSHCSRPVSPRPASARTRGRWSCRGSSAGRFR
jgi:hypothetical protein